VSTPGRVSRPGARVAGGAVRAGRNRKDYAQKLGQVANTIELSRRRDNLTFTHHQEVCRIDEADVQDRFLLWPRRGSVVARAWSPEVVCSRCPGTAHPSAIERLDVTQARIETLLARLLPPGEHGRDV
jgi:hypothetical protein